MPHRALRSLLAASVLLTSCLDADAERGWNQPDACEGSGCEDAALDTTGPDGCLDDACANGPDGCLDDACATDPDGCLDDACVNGPCLDLPCDTPPSDECLNAGTLRTWARSGTCEAGVCAYDFEDIACPEGCAGGICVEDPCLAVRCDSPPTDGCVDAGTLRTWSDAGTCEAGTCRYDFLDATCPRGCDEAACIPGGPDPDPCADITCASPPPVSCDGDDRLTYAPVGRCELGACVYEGSSTPCAFGCAGGVCLVDPCASVACAAPPEPLCVDAQTRRSFAPSGTCVGGVCDYDASDLTCPLGCVSGACVPWEAQMVTAGRGHACALITGGRIVCWGDNRRGQTGVAPSQGLTQAPRLVGGPDFGGFTRIAAGGEHTCALRDGLVYCWGDNRRGQLGRVTADELDPTPGPLPEQRIGDTAHWLGLRVTAGARHTCVNASFESRSLSGTTPLPDRTVCWGDDTIGQLGQTQTSATPRGPVTVKTTLGLSLENVWGQIEAGDAHTCTFATRAATGGVGQEHVLFCWGSNNEEQIGSGGNAMLAAHASLVSTATAPPYEVLGPGGDSTCLSLRRGNPIRREVICRGALPFGDGGSSGSWVDAGPWVDVGDVVVADDFLCVIRDTTGGVECLGQAASGLDPETPTPIGGFPAGARWLSAGADFACAIDAASGALRCWGNNDHGQLGRPGPDSHLVAVPVGP